MQQTESLFHQTLEELEKLAQSEEFKDGLPLGQIVSAFGVNSHLVIIILLCLPFLQPIPLVGVSSILGPIMVLIAVFYLLGKPPWLPESWRRRKLSKELTISSLKKADKIWDFLEKYIKPRGQKYFSGRFFRVLSFLIITTNAFLFSLPLPIPLTNMVPVVVIFLHCLGLLEEDGILVLASLILCLACFAFFASIGVSIEKTIPHIFDWIHSLGL